MNAIHKLLSIGVANNHGYEQCFVREDSSHDSAVKVVENFVDALEEMAKIDAQHMPDMFQKALDNIETDIENEDSNLKKMKLQSFKNLVKNFLRMDVYGFNSGRYDLTILGPYLLPELKRRYDIVKILKKENCYLSISTEGLHFKDIFRFSSPVTLSTYLRQNSVVEQKTIFPYSFFNSVEEINNQIEFPPHSAFYSQLKGENVPVEDYDTAKSEYDKRRSLPCSDPLYMKTMIDWLIHYNLLDCRPLAMAINNSFENFFNIFNLDPSWCLSLPSFAAKCMFKEYSKLQPLCYSFNDKMDDLRLGWKFHKSLS